MGDSAGNPGIGVDRKREVVQALTQWLLFVCAWLGLNGAKQQILKTHITDKAASFFICNLLDKDETALGTLLILSQICVICHYDMILTIGRPP
jgi:hypothetical protein